MSDSVLKKQFERKDVQRLRNLIKKDFGAATNIQAGYSKVINNDHVEGDQWEENGKTWTIKNGIKQNITKLDSFKKLNFVPLACPKCGDSMNSALNKKMYYIHKMCLNCVVKFETHLKIIGKYQEYEKALVTGNIKYFLKDYEDFIKDALATTSNSHITEDGVIEEWKGNIDKEKILQNTKEFIDKAHKELDS
jgi:hypothetical protein